MTTSIDSAFDRFTTKILMLKNHRITVELQDKITATTEHFFEQLVTRDYVISEHQKDREEANNRFGTTITLERRVEEMLKLRIRD